MQNFLDLLSKIKNLPTIGKIFSIIAIVIALIVMTFFTACGVTKARVYNGADGTTTEIKITTNNPTSVNASPNVQLNSK